MKSLHNWGFVLLFLWLISSSSSNGCHH
jgi:hypothetical protein